MWNKCRQKFYNVTLRTKLILVFIATTLVILMVNLFLYININKMINRMDNIYQSNINLNELASALLEVQDGMTAYLNTKTTDAMEEYYRSKQNYNMLVNELRDQVTNNDLMLMERNIREMSIKYLQITNQAIDAKRGRNVEKYKMHYENATQVYEYISTYIYSLNNEQFKDNSSNYKILSVSLHYLELISTIILVMIAFCNVILIVFVTGTITNPLKVLASVANRVAGGELNIPLLQVRSGDEVGVVSSAFNKMLINIRLYIKQITQSMKNEQELKEKELMMETHLKDARLKYLQAQINPHFLFNTFNAGAQLAMMEGADRTYEYIQNTARFFRYNIKKDNDIVTLREEIELIDNYIYILNVRFSGEIQFVKEVEETLTDIKIPGMILQPIVENSVNYGIRNIDWPGEIILSVYEKKDKVCISVRDNGVGVTKEVISRIMTGKVKAEDMGQDSNGVGLSNVIGRLRLLYGEMNVFSILSEGENKGTEVVITIPNAKKG